MPRVTKYLALLLCALFLNAFFLVPSFAQDDTSAISQGFETEDPNLGVGALVSLEQTNANGVELANAARAERLVGVVGEKALIELSGGDQQVPVVISGSAFALVSNINGDVKNGDKITASPINGVGMRTEGGIEVVGTAQSDFSSIQTSERTVRDKNGKDQFVRVGLLPIQVNVTYYAAPKEEMSFLPGFMQQFANSVAGRDVSPFRVLVSAFVLFFGFFSVGVLLYASVRSSIISIGRNPLSEKAVRKSLFQVGFTAVSILLLTLVAIYLILRA